MPDRYVSPPLELPEHDPEDDYVRAEFQFHGVDHSGLSYEARVFLNRTDVDEGTPLELADDGGYVGSFHIFGHGGCYGDVGHCDVPRGPRDPYDLELPHPLTPHKKTVIATDALRRYRNATNASTVTITVIAVVVDPEGLPLGRDVPEPLLFDSVSLVTYQSPPPVTPL
jgi:hypothetical protein